MKKLYILIFLINYLNAMNCSEYKDFKLFNGHYYTISINKLTFDSAKQIAINNNGYLAIPNSQEENDFIKSLIDGGSIAWIGVYDPNNMQNYCYGNNCAYDNSRFKDIKNNSLLYKNFYQNQPDNLVKSYDVVDGKQVVSPLGEHWVGMNGNNGKWYDFGNHADEFNNPVKYKAVFEFENLNECKPLTDDGIQEITGRVCNTKIWDSTIDTITMGQTLNCTIDSYGNEYCPSALSQCGQQWDYENGYSTSGVGSVVDYTNKIQNISYIPANATYYYNWQLTGLDSQWMPHQNNQAYIEGGIGYMSIGSFLANGAVLGYGETTTYSGVNGCSVSSHNTQNQQISGGKVNGFYSPNTTLRLYTNTDWGESYIDIHGEYFTCSLYNITYSCSDGATPVNGQCPVTTWICPPNYQDNGSNCLRTQQYTYYNYLCSNSPNAQGQNFTPTTTGGNTGKSDPNGTVQNDLTSPLNSATPPTNNCKRLKFTCLANADRPCSYVNNQWQCSPFPCLGQSNLESLDTQVGINDKTNNGWSEDGNCTGTIYIFNGKSNKCRTWDMFFGLTGGGCCDKDKVFAGLVSCKENEKILAKKREQKQAHYIGNFCSKQLKLGFTKICVQKSDSYCTFTSALAKIIQEQGRIQLGISWGTAENPECRGFKPEEFQKIDFSKVDLTEFVKDIQSTVQSNVIQNLGTYVKDKVENFYGN